MTFGRRAITWSRIGELYGKNLYLCDTILSNTAFGNIAVYKDSIVRDMCRNLYMGCFSDDERKRMIVHPELHDHVFLLSKEEYIECYDVINPINENWWLRSPGLLPSFAMFVDKDNDVFHTYVRSNIPGLRPAILLKKGE